MENDKEIDMKRDSSDFGVPDMSGLEQAYNESLERLGLTEKSAPAEKNGRQEKVSDDVYEKMLEEVAKRRKVNKSIWTDEPVIPVRKKYLA